MSRFSDTLIEHFQAPVNRGPMTTPDVVGQGSLNGYPPFVTLYLRIADERIIDVRFEAEGCGVTIACGSMLTDLVQGQPIANMQLTAESLSQALGGIPSHKEHCAQVAVAALQDALQKWSAKASADEER